MKEYVSLYIDHETELNSSVWDSWIQLCEHFCEKYKVQFTHLGFEANGAPAGVVPVDDIHNFCQNFEDQKHSLKGIEFYRLPENYRIASADVDVYMCLNSYYLSIEYATNTNINPDFDSIINEIKSFINVSTGEVNLLRQEDRVVFNLQCITLGEDRESERWKHVKNIMVIE